MLKFSLTINLSAFSIRFYASAILYCVSPTGECVLKFCPSINLSVLSKLSIMILPSQFNVTAISPEAIYRRKKTAAQAAVFRVGIDLSSRSVSRQVLSALVSLTSVFGMGTGGPSPLKTPTAFGTHQILQYSSLKVKAFLPRGRNFLPLLVHHQGLEPWTP